MNNKIYELELNFSNVCTANCIICSRPHGYGNTFFMGWDVFTILIKQLKDVNFKIIQTSGNGEAFLNPNYLEYICILKQEFSNIPKWTYNNFSLLDKEKANMIVSKNLFDKIHVRIDSLDKWIFERNSNLNQDIVFDNLKYFLSINDKIPIVILYNNIKEYYKHCIKTIGKRPIRDYYTDEELLLVRDEEQSIKKYFQEYSKIPINVFKIGHSLWGERYHAPKDTKTPCPKINIIQNIVWVCPDGKINCCCYAKKTEVFTNKGWKFFEDLTGTELILTRKSNGDTEWSKIVSMQKYRYKGNLYKIKNNNIDLEVTPDHKFPLLSKAKYNSKLARKPKEFKEGYIWKQIKNFKYSGYKIPRYFRWNGNTSLTKKYTKNFVKLLGWYLTEGFCYINSDYKQIVIYQTPNTSNFFEIYETIKNNGYKPIRDTRAWRIRDNSLYDYLYPLGKSKDKYIPNDIKNLPKEYLLELLKILIKGDGTRYKTGSRYYTVSEKLADDVQEIAYKCGYAANIQIRKPRLNKVGNKNKLGLKQYHVYISEATPNTNIDINYIIKNNINLIAYDSYVYDLTVEKNHTLWVRKNKKCVWSSNCYDDSQSIFTVGDIKEDHILNIFYGEKRKNLLKKIENREITDYPCINPKCCAFPQERKL